MPVRSLCIFLPAAQGGRGRGGNHVNSSPPHSHPAPHECISAAGWPKCMPSHLPVHSSLYLQNSRHWKWRSGLVLVQSSRGPDAAQRGSMRPSLLWQQAAWSAVVWKRYMGRHLDLFAVACMASKNPVAPERLGKTVEIDKRPEGSAELEKPLRPELKNRHEEKELSLGGRGELQDECLSLVGKRSTRS